MKKIILLLSVLVMFTGCDKYHSENQRYEPIPGPKGDQGIPGRDGTDGAMGPQGPQGQTGVGCSVVKLGDITTITCGDSISQVMDGEDAEQIETIALCPSLNGGAFKEYLLRINDELYGVYHSGNSTGLAKIGPGSWVTTDGRNCGFTVTSDLTVIF